MRIELNILSNNKVGHCIRRYFYINNNLSDFEIECSIRDELEKYEALYEYLRIQKYDNKIIATAYNG